MSLDLGELVAFIRTDNSGFKRGVRESKRDMQSLQRDADGRLQAMEGRFVAEGRKSGRGFGREAEKGAVPGLAGLTRAAGAVFRTLGKAPALALTALKFAAIGGAAGGAAVGVLRLVAALAPAVGILAGLPAAAGLAGAALLTLKIATAGVGKAFSTALTGDAQQFNKALEKLSPAAQAAARELRSLRPEFDKLKQSVQGAFFGPLKGQITAVAANLAGPLKTGLSGAAGEFGRLAKAVTMFGTSKVAASTVVTVFRQLKDQLAGIRSDTITNLLKSVAAFAQSALPAFNGLGSSIDRLLRNFTRWLDAATSGGKAMQWITSAEEVFKALGHTAAQAGGILVAIFKAARQSGGDALGVIGQVLGKVNAFLKTAAGQSALVAIFKAFGAAGTALGSVLPALGAALSLIAPQIAHIAAALGPAIAALVTGLGPALAALGPGLTAIATGLQGAFSDPAFIKGLRDLGGAANDLLTAAAPLLPVIAALAGQIVTGLAPAIKPLATAIQQVALELGPNLGRIVEKITPYIPGLADSISQLVIAFIPLLPQLANAAVAMTPLIPLVTRVIEALVKVAKVITPVGIEFIKMATGVDGIVVTVLTKIFDAVQWIATNVGGIPGKIAAQFQRGVAPLVAAVTAIVSGITAVWGSFFTAISTTASAVWNVVKAIFTGNLEDCKKAVRDGITRILGAWSGFFSQLAGIASGIWHTITGIFSASLRTAKSIVSGAISGIKGLWSLGWHNLTTILSSAWSGIISALKSRGSAAVGYMRKLPGLLKNAVGNLSGLLVSAGRAIIDGLWNGIQSAAAGLASKVSSLIDRTIPSPIRKLLGIASPSKVMRTIGWQIMQGLRQGLTGSASQIQSESNKIANAIHKAFAGQKTKKDDRLIAFVQASNNKLKALAGQRDSLLTQIANAKKYAADLASNAKDFASITNLDNTPDTGPTADSIVAGLGQRRAQLAAYAADIAKLSKLGLSKTALQQILDAGPEAGAATAAALVQGGAAVVGQVNSIQAQIDKAAGALGNNGADALYDAGKNAAKGFLTGLTSQEKAIEAQMTKIATSVAKAIKKALKIKSPSKVTAELGGHTGEGFRQGLQAQIAAIYRTSGQLAAAARLPLQGQYPAVSLGSQGARGGDGASAALRIENYHEAPRSSVRATAEDLLLLTKARG